MWRKNTYQASSLYKYLHWLCAGEVDALLRNVYGFITCNVDNRFSTRPKMEQTWVMKGFYITENIWLQNYRTYMFF
jgi:hypothetical protein